MVVDFFAGSGTILHAVNLLNAEDGGHRRCIMVTNNEVSAEEAKNLTEQGYKPGDEEWEKYGIARNVTWPRTVCSIEGHDINGKPLEGNYGIEVDDYQSLEDKFDVVNKTTGKKVKTKIYKKIKKQIYPQYETIDKANGFAANAAFFKLGFLNKNDVALGKQFKQILPVLWMKAGAKGKCPEISSENDPGMLMLPQNGFAVLSDESMYARFESEVNSDPDITTIAAFSNPEFYKAQSMRLSVQGVPRIIDTHEETEKYLIIPRRCLGNLIELFDGVGVIYSLTDNRNIGKNFNVRFLGELHEEQKPPFAALAEFDTGVLSATTAFGKTVVGAKLIAEKGVNTLVLVHNAALLNQWKQSLLNFLKLKNFYRAKVSGL